MYTDVYTAVYTAAYMAVYTAVYTSVYTKMASHTTDHRITTYRLRLLQLFLLDVPPLCVSTRVYGIGEFRAEEFHRARKSYNLPPVQKLPKCGPVAKELVTPAFRGVVVENVQTAVPVLPLLKVRP